MVIVALNYFQWSFRGEQLKRIEDFNRYERLRVTQQEYDLLTIHPPYRLNPNIFIAGNMDCLAALCRTIHDCLQRRRRPSGAG